MINTVWIPSRCRIEHFARYLSRQLRIFKKRERRAVLEADFFGKQDLEFAGIHPSGKEVHVPLCLVYGVQNGKITRANIYFESDAIRMQNSG
jgi:hypothetical protein